MDVSSCSHRDRELVTKEQLLERVWPDVVVVEGVVKRCIAQLREALGDDAHEPRFIETIARKGYRLLVAVEPLAAAPCRPNRQPGQRSSLALRNRAACPSEQRAAAAIVVAARHARRCVAARAAWRRCSQQSARLHGHRRDAVRVLRRRLEQSLARIRPERRDHSFARQRARAARCRAHLVVRFSCRHGHSPRDRSPAQRRRRARRQCTHERRRHSRDGAAHRRGHGPARLVARLRSRRRGVVRRARRDRAQRRCIARRNEYGVRLSRLCEPPAADTEFRSVRVVLGRVVTVA